MLTRKQKKEFERIFNLHSMWKEFGSGFRAGCDDRMWAFQRVASILGYKFLSDKVEEQYGIKYLSYRLEKEEEEFKNGN